MRKLFGVASVAAALAAVMAAGCVDQRHVLAELPAPPFAEPAQLIVRPAPPPAPQGDQARTTPRPPQQQPQQASRPEPWPREWTQHATTRAWRYVVVHHSGTPNGNADSFGKYHTQHNGWEELGYHFVIDNGVGGPDGRIEVGPRWTKQKHGAHCKTNDQQFNNYGVGICLVGDFEKSRPTAAQMAGLRKLIQFLVENYNISPNRIYGHGEAAASVHEGRSTKCPGRYLDMNALRRSIQRLARSE